MFVGFARKISKYKYTQFVLFMNSNLAILNFYWIAPWWVCFQCKI